ncbi:MAG: hypothetical protein HOE75_10920 [Chloroflexi bacterium]|jgi:rifampicin phosphotransferase|nr:hypothetical protein [Chloroflexota bacterium]MBT4074185.1 hypothetical protein [Chloroflexota bacterium]MBT5319707.1 hypothetical protein [Chloroflexota bacterium]MBT6680677.1 hypothetical protein [Chloroflexota bacterium]
MTHVVVYLGPNSTPFPVDWPSPEHAEDRWSWDQVHNPTPLTPLAQDLIAIKRQGMYRGGELTGRPFHEERMYANGYGFSRSLQGDPADAERARDLAEQDSLLRIDHLTELWESSYRPETEALTRLILAWASPDDSLTELLDRYDEVESAWRRCGELHTISTGLAGVAMRQFDEFCRDQFGDEGTRIAVESISGMPNMSVESGKALWELSRRVLEHPEVADLLRTRTLSDFLAELASVAGGLASRTLLGDFLAVWGQRNESYYEVEFDTWIEDPKFVLITLRNYINTPEDQSPAALHKKVVGARLTRTEDVRNRLSESGPLDEFLLGQSRAQQHTVLMEDHNYYIDQRAYTSLRIPHQAIGARLVQAGALESANDVFFLHVDEIKDHANNPFRKYQDLVNGRRADRESWMHVLPPPYIGGDATLADSKQAETTGAKSTTITGLPASAGTVVGTARVILSLDEAHRLEPGDVLVTYATAPPWTPLFAVASAVVTDAGGPLAHCAVVAREYGIPAIVGAGSATTAIRDGDTITVDGISGIVTIHRR